MRFITRLLRGMTKPVTSSEHPLTRDEIRALVHEEAQPYLLDAEWRVAEARQVAGGGRAGIDRQAFAQDLNVLSHALTGFVVSDNMNASGVATPGSIRWQQLHIVYAGVDYTITDGASSLKYHTFRKPASGTGPVTLESNDTKPALGKDDLLVFINNAGIATVPAQGQGSLPGVVADGAVDNGALANGAVSGAKIADSGIGANKLGTGAINLSTQFGGKVVATAALQDKAVGSTQLGDQAVVAGKIGAGAINGSTLFTAGVVDTAAIGSGAVSTTKLNTLSHFLY